MREIGTQSFIGTFSPLQASNFGDLLNIDWLLKLTLPLNIYSNNFDLILCHNYRHEAQFTVKFQFKQKNKTKQVSHMFYKYNIISIEIFLLGCYISFYIL